MIDRVELLDILATMESKMTEALTHGLASVNTALGKLTESSHSALLDQERRNSTFVTREPLDRIATSVEAINREIAGLAAQMATVVRTLEDHGRELDRLSRAGDDRMLRVTRATAGFLASLVAVLLAATITYSLSHGR